MEVKIYEVAHRYASTGVENHGTIEFAFPISSVLGQSDAVKLTPERFHNASCAQKSPPATYISCPARCKRLAQVFIGHKTRCNSLQRHARVLRARAMLLPQARMSLRTCHDVLLHRASRCVRARCNLCGAHQTCAGSHAPSGGAHLTLARCERACARATCSCAAEHARVRRTSDVRRLACSCGTIRATSGTVQAGVCACNLTYAREHWCVRRITDASRALSRACCGTQRSGNQEVIPWHMRR